MCVDMRLLARTKVGVVHLLLSAVVGSAIAALVYGLWFPEPLAKLIGVSNLFWLLVGVDVICGPLLMVVVFNERKSRRELSLDVLFVIFIQMVALVYGVYAISKIRPIALVFEGDRFVAVSVKDIDSSELRYAPKNFQKLSLTGPVLIGTRSAKEQSAEDSLEMFMRGKSTSSEPSWWREYDDSRQDVISAMKALKGLIDKQESKGRSLIEDVVNKIKMPVDSLYYLPLTSPAAVGDWCVILNDHADIVGYIPLDGFY